MFKNPFRPFMIAFIVAYTVLVGILADHWSALGMPEHVQALMTSYCVDVIAFCILIIFVPRTARLFQIFWSGEWMTLGYGRSSWSQVMDLLDGKPAREEEAVELEAEEDEFSEFEEYEWDS